MARGHVTEHILDNLRGSFFMVLAMLGFAFEDMLIKQMAGQMPVGQVVMILGIGGAGFVIVLARMKGEKLITPTLRHPAMILRNAAEVFGTLGFISAIALIPISTASAILQATPLVVTLGASIFLGEAVGWRRWTAICVGLAGVLLIIRPGMEGFDAKSLLALMGVLGLAARDLATRRVPSTLSTSQISFAAFTVSILTGLILLWLGVTGDSLVKPSTADSVRLIAAIGIGIGAYFAIVAATRVGDIAFISPFRYSRLVFALVIGIVAFGERPDALTLTGAFIIVASGLYTLWRETRLTRAKPAL